MYRSPNVVRRLRWAGYVTRMKDGRSAFKILAGTPGGKTPLGSPDCRCEGNIRMDLKEIASIRGIGLIRLRIGIVGQAL